MMMVMNRYWMKILVPALAIAALLAYLVWPRYLPPPDEQNRVFSPMGMSLILPPDWEASPIPADADFTDGLRLRPRADGKLQPSIVLKRYSTAPDVAGLFSKNDKVAKQVTFLGFPGYYIERAMKIEHIYRLIFQANGSWYDLALSHPLPLIFEGSDWQQYLETFRAADGSSREKPATAQATNPS